jgi:hypothetical protein
MAHLDSNNVVDWSGRPRRTTRAPLSYWEEFVQKDTWYLAKLLEDVPPEEMHAACVDDDFTGDMEECGEESDMEVNEDELAVLLDFLDEEEGEDTEYVPAAEEEESSSDEEEESSHASEGDADRDDAGTDSGDGEEEEVHGSSEGE